MKLHARCATHLLGLLLAVVLSTACDDPSSTTAINETLLPADSLNRGDARVRHPVQQSYDTIEGMEGVVSTLEGVGILVDPAITGGATTSRLYLIGRRDGATDDVFVTDTMLVLDDTDGAVRLGTPANITYRNTDYVPAAMGEPTVDLQTLTYSTSQTSPVVADWDYLRIWSWDAADDVGDQTRSVNVVGVSTSPTDMPTSGGFDYDLTGFSLALHRQGGSTSFRRATATASVDFDAGTVDVDLTHQDANIDSIEVTGMLIDGNAFTGGVVKMIDNGVDVTAARTGGVNGVDAAGLFFGPVVDGAPMEIGGEITIQGLTTSYHVFFIAK